MQIKGCAVSVGGSNRYARFFPMFLLMLLSACAGDSNPVSPTNRPRPGAPSAMIAIDTTEDTWNYYSADVTITRSAGENSASITNGTTQSSHNIVRTLSGNLWSSSLSFSPLPSMGVGTTPSANVDIASLQTDDAGDYLQIYRRDGTLVSVPADLTTQYPTLSPPSGHSPLPTFPASPPGAPDIMTTARLAPSVSVDMSVPLGGVNSRGHRVDPRAWLANVIVTPKNRIALASGRLKQLGASVGNVGKLNRFLHQGKDNTTLEELVDPVSGATVERNVAVNGQLMFHMTRSYADAGNGRYVLTGMHIESRRAGTSDRPTLTDIAYNNIHVETRATP